MAGEAFQQLLDIGDRGGGRTAIQGVRLNQAVEEAQAVEEHSRDVQKVRQREKAITAKANAAVEARKEARALWGTDDPKKIAAIKATGAFDPDLAQRMQIDPVGTAAQVERAAAIAGKGGVQDAPDVPPAREFYRENERGVLEFTNRPEAAPSAEGWRRYSSDSGMHKDVGAPGGSVGRISAGDGGQGDARPVEDVLFEGRLGQARQISERPERQAAKAAAMEKYFEEVFDASPDVRTARERIKSDLINGTFADKGLELQDIQRIDKEVIRRAKPLEALAGSGLDTTYFKPWVKGRPGEAADQAEPASVLNPGGGTGPATRVEQESVMARNEAAAAIETSLPKEKATAYDYAKRRKKSPSPQRTPGRKSPSPKPGTTLAGVAERENPIDSFINAITPERGIDPAEALRRRRTQALPTEFGF